MNKIKALDKAIRMCDAWEKGKLKKDMGRWSFKNDLSDFYDMDELKRMSAIRISGDSVYIKSGTTVEFNGSAIRIPGTSFDVDYYGDVPV